MDDLQLLGLWAAIRLDLELAAGLVPPGAGDGPQNLATFQEWLDHNELELALEDLEALGDENEVPQEFWHLLREAAKKMALTTRVERYSRRLEQS